MSFNELLIELVKEYTCLYNQKDKRFRDKERKTNAWEEIGMKLKHPGLSQNCIFLIKL